MTSPSRRYVVHYQPKVSLGRPGGAGANGIIGHEALIRQRHDTVLISPGAIFAGMEGSNLHDLLMETSAFVLEEACRVLENRLSPSVSINIPPSMLTDAEFMNLLTAKAPSSGGMTLEIMETEGPPIPTMVQACRRLERSGYRISMDDFGEGESNLVRLIALEPKEVKLDAKLLAFPAGRRIMRSLTAVIQETGASVCVEGVETEEDHALACEAGASSGQGYFYGIPVAL